MVTISYGELEHWSALPNIRSEHYKSSKVSSLIKENQGSISGEQMKQFLHQKSGD